MKLKNIILLSVLALGTLTFVACGDDDDVTPTNPNAQESTPVDTTATEQTPDSTTIKDNNANKKVVGTYIGYTALTTNMINKVYEGDTLTLALSDQETLTATFKNKVWGIATIMGIKAQSMEGKDAGYILEGGEGQFVMNNPRDNSTQTFYCKLDSALINADKTQMIAVIKANMDVAGAHGEMTFTFRTGEMPSEE